MAYTGNDWLSSVGSLPVLADGRVSNLGYVHAESAGHAAWVWMRAHLSIAGEQKHSVHEAQDVRAGLVDGDDDRHSS